MQEVVEADLQGGERAEDEALFFLGEGGQDLGLGTTEEEGTEDLVELGEDDFFVYL